jgi:hypothetical protein
VRKITDVSIDEETEEKQTTERRKIYLGFFPGE